MWNIEYKQKKCVKYWIWTKNMFEILNINQKNVWNIEYKQKKNFVILNINKQKVWNIEYKPKKCLKYWL